MAPASVKYIIATQTRLQQQHLHHQNELLTQLKTAQEEDTSARRAELRKIQKQAVWRLAWNKQYPYDPISNQRKVSSDQVALILSKFETASTAQLRPERVKQGAKLTEEGNTTHKQETIDLKFEIKAAHEEDVHRLAKHDEMRDIVTRAYRVVVFYLVVSFAAFGMVVAMLCYVCPQIVQHVLARISG